jgi:hypothetical protein
MLFSEKWNGSIHKNSNENISKFEQENGRRLRGNPK